MSRTPTQWLVPGLSLWWAFHRTAEESSPRKLVKASTQPKEQLFFSTRLQFTTRYPVIFKLSPCECGLACNPIHSFTGKITFYFDIGRKECESLSYC